MTQSKQERFRIAVEFLQSRLTLETAAEILADCQRHATAVQRVQHTHSAKEYDDLVLMELEKHVMMLKISEKAALKLNKNLRF